MYIVPDFRNTRAVLGMATGIWLTDTPIYIGHPNYRCSTIITNAGILNAKEILLYQIKTVFGVVYLPFSLHSTPPIGLYGNSCFLQTDELFSDQEPPPDCLYLHRLTHPHPHFIHPASSQPTSYCRLNSKNKELINMCTT